MTAEEPPWHSQTEQRITWSQAAPQEGRTGSVLHREGRDQRDHAPFSLAGARAPPAWLRRVTRGRAATRTGANSSGDRGRAGSMAAAATTTGLEAPEPMPSYAEMLQRSWASALAAARGCGDCGWGLARRGLAEHAHLAAPELLLAVLCALGWTALRSAATTRIFRVSETWGPLRIACERVSGASPHVFLCPWWPLESGGLRSGDAQDIGASGYPETLCAGWMRGCG